MALEALIRERVNQRDNHFPRGTAGEGTEEDLVTTEHYESASLLRDSARAGCHLCTLMLDSLDRWELDFRDSGGARRGGIELSLLVDVSDNHVLVPRIQGWMSGPLRGPRIWITTPRVYTLPPLTLSVATVSTEPAACAPFYMRCMDICDKTHTRCHVKRVERLPTRLLRVASTPGGTGTGTAPCVQLVSPGDEGLEFPKGTRFAALSYCWGEQRGLRLTESNYKSLTVDVPFDQLPATIQDSVVVTINLGLQYLWVDALCIVQDSPEDWSREADKMCDVYQGCSVSLVASAASNSGEGLFAVRDPLLQAPCLLFGTTVAQSRDEYQRQQAHPWALETRGWAMQEHLLPARAVKFASYLAWECRELSINEFGLESQLDTDSLPREFSSLILEPGETDPVDVARVRRLWWLILKRYRRSRLSVKSDRLAAIAGLTSAIQRRTGWTFVCGLWQPFIIQELLWYRSHGPNGSTGLRPSWSWASCDGGVHFVTDEDHKGSTQVAEYVRTIPSPNGQAPSFSPAAIELSGLLFRAHKVGKLQVLRVEGWPDSSFSYTIYDQLGRPWRDGDMLLPLSVWDGRQAVKGLVVAPTKSPTTFERVGHFHTSVNPVRSHADMFYRQCDEMQRLLAKLKGSSEEPFVRQKILLI